MAKEWSWSFTKKKNYDTCPKRHYEVDILKNFTDSTEQLKWGNEVHDALAKACAGKDPLPEGMSYQAWVDIVRSSPGKLLVEQKYAITRKFEKTSWFADNVWYRGICDLLRINGDTATALDWKTGQRIDPNSIQLMLMATCILVHHPEINTVKTRFIWLAHDKATTPAVFTRAEIMTHWQKLLPEIEAMKRAAETLTYPPKPGHLCRKHCPVTSCPFHGKGNR